MHVNMMLKNRFKLYFRHLIKHRASYSMTLLNRCLTSAEIFKLNLGPGILSREYLWSNDGIGSFSVVNTIPTYVLRSISTSSDIRLSTSHPKLVVVWRSSIAAASHQWMIKTWEKIHTINRLANTRKITPEAATTNVSTYHTWRDWRSDHTWWHICQCKQWLHS